MSDELGTEYDVEFADIIRGLWAELELIKELRQGIQLSEAELASYRERLAAAEARHAELQQRREQFRVTRVAEVTGPNLRERR